VESFYGHGILAFWCSLAKKSTVNERRFPGC